MFNHPRSIPQCLTLLTAMAVATAARAGSLTPPGGPVLPTMKNLTDVEPRTVIKALPFAINQSGSYYLAGNLTGLAGQDGITVNANDVTIDLNGFSLIGVAGSGKGVTLAGGTKFCLKNGGVRNWGGAGVNATNRNGVEIDCVTAQNNGAEGLALGAHARVSNCIALDNGGDGFTGGYYSRMQDCIAGVNGTNGAGAGFAIYSASTLTRCGAHGNHDAGIAVATNCRIIDCNCSGNQAGITSTSGANVSGCSCTGNTKDGIFAGSDSTVRNCNCTDNGDDGIQTEGNCLIIGNNSSFNGTSANGAGVYITGSQTRIEDNHLSYNRFGLLTQGGATENFIVKNTARGNAAGNFNISAGNDMAPVISNPGGNNFATATAWSNFAY